MFKEILIKKSPESLFWYQVRLGTSGVEHLVVFNRTKFFGHFDFSVEEGKYLEKSILSYQVSQFQFISCKMQEYCTDL